MCTNNENITNSSSVSVKKKLTLAEKLKYQLALRNRAADLCAKKAEETILANHAETTFTVSFPLRLDSEILRIYLNTEGYKILESNNNVYKIRLTKIQETTKEKLNKIINHIKATSSSTIAIDGDIYFRVEVGEITNYDEKMIKKFAQKLGFDSCTVKKGTNVILLCSK